MSNAARPVRERVRVARWAPREEGRLSPPALRSGLVRYAVALAPLLLLVTVASKWQPGDTIPLGRRTLRVIGVRDVDVDETPVLVVEDMSG
jgi:hypothetical protein